MEAKTYPQVRAVHHDGVLELLDAVELPEGAQVRLLIQAASPGTGDRLTYPTRLVPADRLDRLTALVEAGGDALAESEALYDPDCD
jgi:hypothetical protein